MSNATGQGFANKQICKEKTEKAQEPQKKRTIQQSKGIVCVRGSESAHRENSPLRGSEKDLFFRHNRALTEDEEDPRWRKSHNSPPPGIMDGVMGSVAERVSEFERKKISCFPAFVRAHRFQLHPLNRLIG